MTPNSNRQGDTPVDTRGARVTGPPFDLPAVEEQFRSWIGSADPQHRAIAALLFNMVAHCRWLRVALIDLMRETTHRGDCAPLGCTACQAFARATAVLAQAQDGP